MYTNHALLVFVHLVLDNHYILFHPFPHGILLVHIVFILRPLYRVCINAILLTSNLPSLKLFYLANASTLFLISPFGLMQVYSTMAMAQLLVFHLLLIPIHANDNDSTQQQP